MKYRLCSTDYAVQTMQSKYAVHTMQSPLCSPSVKYTAPSHVYSTAPQAEPTLHFPYADSHYGSEPQDDR